MKFGYLLSAQSVLTHAAWTGVKLLIGFRAVEIGANPTELGLIIATLSIPSLLLAITIGGLADHYGGPMVVMLGCALGLVSAVLVLTGGTALHLMMCGLLLGSGQMMSLIGQQHIVATVAPVGKRDTFFGYLMASASIGQMIGPILVATIIATVNTSSTVLASNTDPGFITVAVLSFLALPITLIYRNIRPLRGGNKSSSLSSAFSVLRSPGVWRSFVLSGVVIASMDLLYVYLPVWAVERNIGIEAVSLLLAIRAASSILCRFGLQKLIRRFGRKKLLGLSMLLGAVAFVWVPFANFETVVVLMVVLGISFGLPQPLTLAWTLQVIPAQHQGSAIGIRLTSNRLFQVIMPVFSGALAGFLGTSAFFYISSLTMGGASLVLIRSNADSGIEE